MPRGVKAKGGNRSKQTNDGLQATTTSTAITTTEPTKNEAEAAKDSIGISNDTALNQTVLAPRLSRESTAILGETAAETPSPLELPKVMMAESSPPRGEPRGSVDSPSLLPKKKVDDIISTPRGRPERPLFMSHSSDFPRKRPLSGSLLSAPLQPDASSSHRSSRLATFSTRPVQDDLNETNEKRAQRLGAELNLATPAGWRRKTLAASPGSFIPVPKAWSTLVLDSRPSSRNSGETSRDGSVGLSPASASNGVILRSISPQKSLDDSKNAKVLEEMRKQNEELLRSNQLLERENGMLKKCLPPLRLGPSSGAETDGVRKVPGSPLKKGEPLYGSHRFDSGYGLGHPDAELIMEVETKDTDDSQTAQTKAAARQLFSLTTLLRTIREAAVEDRQLLAQTLHQAREQKMKLDEAYRKISSLEDELATLKQGNQAQQGLLTNQSEMEAGTS